MKIDFKKIINSNEFKIISCSLLVIILITIIVFKNDNKFITNSIDSYDNFVNQTEEEQENDNNEEIEEKKDEIKLEDNKSIKEIEKDTTSKSNSTNSSNNSTTSKNNSTNNFKDNNTENNNQSKEETTKSNDNTEVIANYEESIINYFNETANKLDSDALKEGAKKDFITITDFLFYNGKIKGHTFEELSNKTKLTVLKIALKIDKKIDNAFPDYKENISKQSNKIYTDFKLKVIEKYLNITTKVCENNNELCASAKEDFQNMKDSFSISWSIIKSLAKSGSTNLKEWYEIYSGK